MQARADAELEWRRAQVMDEDVDLQAGVADLEAQLRDFSRDLDSLLRDH